MIRVGDDGRRARATGSRSTAAPAWSRVDDVPLVEPRSQRALRARARRGPTSCAGSACAPTPTRPRTRCKAREHGAEGIGLCRTEHMFMAADRQPKMRAMIMADGERRAPRRAGRAAAAAAGRLRGPVRGDGRAAGHDPPARPAAARVPARPRRAARSASSARATRRAAELAALERSSSCVAAARRGQPDARHARLPARDRASRDLRDAGRGDHARGARCASAARAAAPGDHDPAGRLRGASSQSCASWSSRVGERARPARRARTTSSAR